MPNNKSIHITYIGRLVPEKGIEILIDCIERSIEEKRNIIWHICGDGSYMRELRRLQKDATSDIRIYGHIDQQKIDEVLNMTDLVLMPSLFLETFGLVALDALSHGVPVCGFARGGLVDLIHPLLALNIGAPVDSFFLILDRGIFPILDISQFAHTLWIERLTTLTKGMDRILLISDYTSIVGGAEQYVSDLALALESIGKQVEIYGYEGGVSRLMRLWLMCLTPFAFWRGAALSKKIATYQPDLIWMHSVLRYIGPYGIRAIYSAPGYKYITHHDLGLITPWPSRIYSEADIPAGSHLGDWVSHRGINLSTLLAITGKWILVSSMWYYLRHDLIVHIFPSHWMLPFFQRYGITHSEVFHHTSQNIAPVKK